MKDNNSKIFEDMAFPLVVIDKSTPGKEIQHVCTGMTLRDYFAAKAMQGLIVGQATFDADTPYKIADSMLKARKA